MRKRHKSKHPSQLQIGSLGRKSVVIRFLPKKSEYVLDTDIRVPKFTSYLDQYAKSKSRIKLEGDLRNSTVPEGIQTENLTEEEEEARLELKIRAREEYVRRNTTKVLHWLFERTNTKGLTEIGKDEAEEGDETWPGILALLSATELSMIRYPEWRLVIDGNQFNIIANEDQGNSFYRALAQAVTMNEDNAEVIRRQLCEYVTNTRWGVYEPHIRNKYLKGSAPLGSKVSSAAVAKMYRYEQLRVRKPGSYFQLRLAAEMYNFNFVLVFKKRHSVKWFTFASSTRSRKTVAFLIWPTNSGTPVWKILYPLDSTEIQDGEYPFFIKRTFPVQQCCYAKTSSTNNDAEQSLEFPDDEDRLNIITLQAGKEEFEFPLENLSLPQTLYSLLSHILFGNLFHAEEIRTEILEHRDRFEYFINLNPRRKNSHQKKLFASHYRQEWGDAVDLKIAASIYKFCYTVIAMDRIGNLSHISECRDRTHSHYANRHDINFLAFFTRVTPRSLAWFKLELFGWNKLLHNEKINDDIETMRSEYFTLSKHRGPSTIINNELGTLSEIPQFRAPETLSDESQEPVPDC